jgi:hypothetical protein
VLTERAGLAWGRRGITPGVPTLVVARLMVDKALPASPTCSARICTSANVIVVVTRPHITGIGEQSVDKGRDEGVLRKHASSLGCILSESSCVGSLVFLRLLLGSKNLLVGHGYYSFCSEGLKEPLDGCGIPGDGRSDLLQPCR